MNPFTTLPKLIKSKKYVDEIEKDTKTMNPTNWRTTASGIIAALLQLANIWIPASNTKATATVNAATALFVAIGLYHAADKQNIG